MTWDYRVIKETRIQGDDTINTYSIYEVYYDEDNNIEFISKDPINPHGESLEELQGDLEYMIKALVKPLLDMKEVELMSEERAKRHESEDNNQ